MNKVLSDLKFLVTHPATIRKELLALASSAGTVAAATELLHLPGGVSAGITAAGTFIVTLLTPANQTKDAAKAKDAAKRT